MIFFLSLTVSLPEIESLRLQFSTLSSVVRTDNSGGIDRTAFRQCLGTLGTSSNLIIERLFNFFDIDNDDVISFPEFVLGLSILRKGTREEYITGTICCLFN